MVCLKLKMVATTLKLANNSRLKHKVYLFIDCSFSSKIFFKQVTVFMLSYLKERFEISQAKDLEGRNLAI